MLRTEPPRNETFDGLSQDIRLRTLENPHGGRIEDYDALLAIHGDDRVHGRSDDAGHVGLGFTHRLLCLHALRYVPQGHGEQLFAASYHLRDGGLDLKFLAICSQRPQHILGPHGPAGNAGFAKLMDVSSVAGVKSPWE